MNRGSDYPAKRKKNSDSLFRTATLDLREWNGNDLLDYLFKTKQLTSYEDGSLVVVNQACQRGHFFIDYGIKEYKDPRYPGHTGKKCRECERLRKRVYNNGEHTIITDRSKSNG